MPDDAGSPRPTGSPSTSRPRRRSTSWTTPTTFPTLVERLRAAPLVAIDTETSSLQPHDAELVGLSLAACPDRGLVSAVRPSHPLRPGLGSRAPDRPVRNLPAAHRLRDGAARTHCSPTRRCPKAGHNIKYDWQVLRGAGVELAGVAYDSMLASFVLDPGRRSHAIDNLCLEHLGPDDADLSGGRRARERPRFPSPRWRSRRRRATAARTAPRCSRCTSTSRPRSREMRWSRLLREIEMPLVRGARGHGVGGHRHRPGTLRPARATSWAPISGGWRARFAQVAGVRAQPQLAPPAREVLFEKHQLPVLKKTKTGPSTDADVLEQLAAMGHELPRLILEYRELQKLKSTYVDTLPAAREPQDRADPHQLQPGRRRDGPAQLQPIPTSRTSRCAPRGARRSGEGFVPRAGLDLPGGGLLPDRAAADGAPVGGSGVHRGVPPGRRHPPADRGAHLQRAAPSR